LLLLDEPLSALDARVRASLRGEIAHLQRRLGVTTIMVTHDQEEALTMADRIVVMDQGVIVQIGTPEEVYGRPATPFAANFVGMMNSLPGWIEGNRLQCGDIVLSAVPADAPLPTGPVTVAIRPEDARIAGVSLDQSNSFLANLREVEFLGSFYRLRLGVNGNTAVSLTVDLSVTEARDLDLTAGRSLPVQLPAERLHLFTAVAEGNA
jgi:iron(III) transport system ATP-binding protein